MVDKSIINRARFIGKDFDTILSETLDFLQNRFTEAEFSNFKESELGIMLIELFSFMFSTLAFTLDRNASEVYLSTAVLPQNIVRIARQLGFKIRGAIPTHGDVQLTLSEPQTTKIVIPIGTQLVSDEYVFETTTSVFWDIGETGVRTVSVVEGETLEEFFTSDGLPNQVKFLTKVGENQFLGDQSVKVYVDGAQWSEVSFLTFEQQNIFEVSYVSDPPFVQFGDGVAGNIPPFGSEIRVLYRVHNGKNASVKANAITDLREPILVGIDEVPIEVNNEASLITGDNGESVSRIVALAPFVFKTVGRSVTEEDYNAIANSFSDPLLGAVGKAKAVIVRSMADDVYLQDLLAQFSAVLPPYFVSQLTTYLDQVYSGGAKANIVQLHVVERDSITRKYVRASQGLVKGLRDRLNERKESTVKIEILDGSRHLFAVDVEVEVKIKPYFDRTAIKLKIKDAIEEHLLDKGFGEAVRLSDLYDIVETIEGVDFSHVKLLEPYSELTPKGDIEEEEEGDFEVLPSPSKLTPKGDIEVAAFEILTLGTVTVLEIE